MNISISRNGVEIGEWTEDEVRALYKDGRLVATDHYWREGMSAWAILTGLIKPPPPMPTSKQIDPPSLPPDSFPDKSPEPLAKPEKQGVGIRLPAKMVQAAALLVALLAMAGGEELAKEYPDPAKLVFMGGLLGLGIGFIPYCVARFVYKSNRYNHYLWIGAAVGVVGGLGYWPSYFDGQLAEACQNQNKMLPAMIFNELRADSVSMGAGRIVRCHYTMIDAPLGIDPIKFITIVRPQFLGMYRTSPSFQFFRANGVAIAFDFSYPNGTIYESIEIGPHDSQ